MEDKSKETLNVDINRMISLLTERPIFIKVWGSWSHNTNIPGSDVDYLGVFSSPSNRILSLDPPSDIIVKEKPDFQAYEALKFAQLLVKGNPAVIECLFTEKFYWGSLEWDYLKSSKQKLLSQKVVEQYLGYAKGQLHRLKNDKSLHTSGGKYNTKWAYHIIRILDDGLRIAQGGVPVVWKEGEEKEFLKQIRYGKYSKDEIYSLAENRINKIDSLKPWNLPEKADKGILNEWLRLVYFESLNGL